MAKTEKHFDRIKVIRRLSRAYAEPHGKAGPHADKDRRRRRRSEEWLAEVEEEEVLKIFRVDCQYTHGTEIRSLGMITVPAPDKETAIAEAIERRWDPRLESVSCLPCFKVEEIE